MIKFLLFFGDCTVHRQGKWLACSADSCLDFLLGDEFCLLADLFLRSRRR